MNLLNFWKQPESTNLTELTNSNEFKKDIVNQNFNTTTNNQIGNQIGNQISNQIVNPDSDNNFKTKQMTLLEYDTSQENEKKEELNELQNLLNDLIIIQEINKDLANIVREQGNNLQIIEHEIIKVNDVVESSNMELIKVEELRADYTMTKFTVSTIGTAVIGVVAVSLVGIKIGLILCATAFTTGTVWSIWPQKINTEKSN